MRPTIEFRVAFLLAIVTAVAMPPAVSSASHVFDASQDFDTSFNPSHINGGTFSYGYENTLGGSFALFPGTFSHDAALGYDLPGFPDSLPGISKNTTNAVFVIPEPLSSITYQPLQLMLHPGADGQYAVLRFTAPAAGTYSYSAVFNAGDDHPTTTDVHVLIDGISVADAGINIAGGGSIATFSAASLTLSAGDTIDFAVGYGNGEFSFDSTGLVATITAVPEPSTVALLVVGAICLAAGALRRQGGL